ncbi:MAG: ABC transporter ATP-binding protein [Campylobacteraceae bacterium]|nr:ABC transporter ATP-binding protein [Campylobacteraceae bacterium]
MKKVVFELKNVNKSFELEGSKDTLNVINNLNLDIYENQFVCLVGPSGCGKSTLLRILSGLETATSGQVLYRGKEHKKPTKDIGVVFQNYSLLPWINVEKNIALGLKFKKMPKAKREEIVNEYLEIVGLTNFRKSYPHQLSGGMQQRVAIARSLANSPDVILMDEPFGALDAYTRIGLQKELLRIWEQHKKTIVFVTHSVDEAIYLADRIILMGKGKKNIVTDIEVKMSGVRERANPEYAKLNQELLDKLESINS